MKDIPIKSFVDVARNVEDLNAKIAVDSKGESNALLGGRAVGVLKPNTDNQMLVKQNLVTHHDAFRYQLMKLLSLAYSGTASDRQFQMIAQAAALVDDKGKPIKGPLTVAQVEVVRIELAHRGLGKPPRQLGGADELMPGMKEKLLDITHYAAGKAKYDKAKKENEVDSARSSAPQEKLGDEQLEQLTKSVKNALNKCGIGDLVDGQLAKLNKSGIDEIDRKQLESWVVLSTAVDASHSPGLNPFKLDGKIKGAIWAYKQARKNNKVASHMNGIQKECDILADTLKTDPLPERRIKLHDDAVQDARALAFRWIKTGQKDGKQIVKALDAAFSKMAARFGKLKIRDDKARYDAETEITRRAYGMFLVKGSLEKKDITNILEAVVNKYNSAINEDKIPEHREDWKTSIQNFVLDVYGKVANSRARRKPLSSPPPPTPNVQRKRANRNYENSPVFINDPRVAQQEAYQAIEKLGFKDILDIQLANLRQTITNPKHLEVMSELLILRALGGYRELQGTYYDAKTKKADVPNEAMIIRMETNANSILSRYGGEKDSNTIDKLIGTWRAERDSLAEFTDAKIDIKTTNG